MQGASWVCLRVYVHIYIYRGSSVLSFHNDHTVVRCMMTAQIMPYSLQGPSMGLHLFAWTAEYYGLGVGNFIGRFGCYHALIFDFLHCFNASRPCTKALPSGIALHEPRRKMV